MHGRHHSPLLQCLMPALVLVLVLLPQVVRADNWRATLYNEGLPSRLVAVDKQRQTFLYFEKKARSS